MPVSLSKALYPLLMFVTVFRTLLVRVHPDSLLVFKPYDDDDRSAPSSRGMQCSSLRQGSARRTPPSRLSTKYYSRLCFARMNYSRLSQVGSWLVSSGAGRKTAVYSPGRTGGSGRRLRRRTTRSAGRATGFGSVSNRCSWTTPSAARGSS